MLYHLKEHILIIYFLAIVFLIFNCTKNDDNFKDTPKNLQIDFVKSLGGSKNESAQSIIKTIDGGYAILGYTQSMDGDITNKTDESFNYWLLKYTKNDILEWQKNYGGSNDDRGNDIIQTKDGGYAITGHSKSNDKDLTENNGAQDFWISKLDSSGNILWEHNYGFLGIDIGYSIIETNDNGFLLTGTLDVSASNGEGNKKNITALKTQHAGGDYWVIKTNALGEKEWSNFFGGSFTDTSFDAIQTEDNGYILVGSSDSVDVDIKNNKGAYDFWVVKISETGTLVWEKSFGGSQSDEARAITKSNDGNYIIIGNTRSNNLDVSINKGAADFWVIKISPNGSLIWEKTFGGTNFDTAHSISKTQDGGYLISGNSRSLNNDITNNNGQNDALIIKITTNGKLEWQQTIGGSEIDFAHDAVELNDKSIITVGETLSSDFDLSNNKGFLDLLIFKLK